MTKRRFHKTVVEIEILSEEYLGDTECLDLDTVVCQITDGEWSGDMKVKSREEMDGKQAADALVSQGSSPSFFNLNEEGENDDDLDDEG